MKAPHSLEYEKYMRSARWREIASKMKEYTGFICQRCGYKFHPSVLDVHHLNYERLGKERPSDLQVLCRARCHPIADIERKERVGTKHLQRREEYAQNTFLSKKYGENYSTFADQGMYEEAEHWLAKKRYGETGEW